MRAQSAIGFLTRAARPLHRGVLATNFAWRKRAALSAFGLSLATLPVAEARLHDECESPVCRAHAEAVARQIRNCVRAGDGGGPFRAFRPTALAIDLRPFRGLQDYLDRVAKLTGGRYRRSANKARRLGYAARPIGEHAYAESARRILESSPWRSHGPVLAAVVRRRDVVVDVDAPPVPPDCGRHWVQAWGAFRTVDGKESMVARAVMRRAGGAVVFEFFMGHAGALTDGAMKLLQFDIMAHLLAREEDATRGVDFIFQGSAEVGTRGILDWKRYTGFLPHAVVCPDDRPFVFPEGFDARTYRSLNPDLAGADAREHFVYHGVREGRRFRP